MSKRRNRETAPNLPQETLERARRQAAIDRGEALVEPELVVEEVSAEPAIVMPENPYRTRSSAERRARESVNRPANRRRDGVKREKLLSQEEISELLSNPTRTVTEAQLRADYNYVLADIRSMFLLAAGLIVALVLLATVLPK